VQYFNNNRRPAFNAGCIHFTTDRSMEIQPAHQSTSHGGSWISDNPKQLFERDSQVVVKHQDSSPETLSGNQEQRLARGVDLDAAFVVLGHGRLPRA
jgi:hypothetical protein